jgi:hypothetical protein
MRVILALLVMVALPALAPAQSRVEASRISGALPPIGLPLPRISAPLAPIRLPPAVEPAARPTAHRQPPVHVGHGRPHPGRARRSGGTAIFFIPAYGWTDRLLLQSGTSTPTYQEPSPAPQPREAEADTGTLRLIVEPFALMQVYVDGFFVGTPSDFDGDLQLEAGAHSVELRAPGYEAISFAVRISAGRSVTYRRSLEPVATAPAPAAAAPVPPTVPRTTVYVIPGCYLGNVPPKDAGLPETCDQTRVTTFQP